MNKSVCNFRIYSISFTQKTLVSLFCLALSTRIPTPFQKYSFWDDFHIILLRIDYYSSIVRFHHISYHWKEKWTIFIHLFLYCFFSSSSFISLFFHVFVFFFCVLHCNNIHCISTEALLANFSRRAKVSTIFPLRLNFTFLFFLSVDWLWSISLFFS